MKEWPIIFSGESVRAILAGHKTQTRRAIKPQPGSRGVFWNPVVVNGYGGFTDEHGRPRPCPYGLPGDQLWVRETWGSYDDITCCPDDLPNFTDPQGVHHPVVHFAGAEGYAWGMYGPPTHRSPIYMPRRASRLTLEIVSVRAEPLQNIIASDCQAEGIEGTMDLRTRYETIWNDLNAKRGHPWDSNPWVWVIEFKRAEQLAKEMKNG